MARYSILELDPLQRHMQFAFVLMQDFSLLPVSAAIEALRNANRVLDEEIYSWIITSDNNEPVQSSSEIAFPVNTSLDDIPKDTVIIVCGGVDSNKKLADKMKSWLRKRDRLSAAPIGALCLGGYALASAGLLENYRCTIHWENLSSFQEDYPDLDIRNSLYEIDRDRFTCCGGTAVVDMMLSMISSHHGEDIAASVAEAVVHSTIRHPSENQRMALPARLGIRHPKLLKIIERMENNLEEPISPRILAADVSMSTRQLERLFRRYLNRSPKRYYLELRLKQARKLLLQTSLPVIDVALACGFSSPSHFSKSYRAFFGKTPYRERGLPGSKQEAETASTLTMAD